jgi:hypothetical protein
MKSEETNLIQAPSPRKKLNPLSLFNFGDFRTTPRGGFCRATGWLSGGGRGHLFVSFLGVSPAPGNRSLGAGQVATIPRLFVRVARSRKKIRALLQIFFVVVKEY